MCADVGLAEDIRPLLIGARALWSPLSAAPCQKLLMDDHTLVLDE
jgi:hypothetical protein